MIRCVCESCNTAVEVSDSNAGSRIACKNCKAILRVPTVEQSNDAAGKSPALGPPSPPPPLLKLAPFKLTIRIESQPGTTLALSNVSPDRTVAELIADSLGKVGLSSDENTWLLTYQNSVLSPEAQLHSCLPVREQAIELVLRHDKGRQEARTSSDRDNLKDIFEADFLPPLQSEESGNEFHLRLEDEVSAAETSSDRHDEEDFSSSDIVLAVSDTDLEAHAGAVDDGGSEVVVLPDEEEEPGLKALVIAAGACAGPAPKRKCRVEEEEEGGIRSKESVRRATVRCYSRMKPERVYPLLVLISPFLVKKILSKHTEQQASKPFQVDFETPVEIEPVLPGCECYPSKVIARLVDGELSATFRVVPRVLGRVEGASVTIRQNHALLAEVGLNIKVVKHTWVVFSGAMTFVLPGLSAVLKHFGVNFEGQEDHGVSVLLAVARLVLDHVPPLSLMTGLGLATALLWWFTRPQSREAFFGIEKVGPAEILQQIAASRRSNPQEAAKNLVRLLDAFPDYQPAILIYAKWHYHAHNYRAALKGYGQALKRGPIAANDYLTASVAAFKLRESAKALQILQLAEKALPVGSITSDMLYNMCCYHTQLGNFDKAITSLQRALTAGLPKAGSYLKNPALSALRSRPDFQRLLAGIR